MINNILIIIFPFSLLAVGKGVDFAYFKAYIKLVDKS